MYLIPTKADVIPVSPLTDGFDTQRLAVNFHDYPGTGNHNKLVFLFSNANGLCKECFHPIMRRLIDYLRSLTEYDQTDITFVSWDGRNQGDSALLNKDTPPSSRYSWIDHSLDIKQVIDFYDLKEKGQLIGIGHSFSATCMILLEFHAPNTFDGMCLFEPGFSPKFEPMESFLKLPYLSSSLNRREEWPSREACAEHLATKAVFGQFHSETLDLYVNYGTYETNEDKIKLKCPKEEETHINFGCHKPAFTSIKMLEFLKIPTHIVIATDSHVPVIDFGAIMLSNRHQVITTFTAQGTHMFPYEDPAVTIPQIKFLLDFTHKPYITLDSKL